MEENRSRKSEGNGEKTENNRNNSILELMANYHGNLYS